jgi:uncharacterized membrane protein YuzA (DUF378 family)
MKKPDVLALVLVVVGALNWGLVAVARYDLVAAVVGRDFGQTNAVSRIVYGLVGLSALWLVARARALRPAPAHPSVTEGRRTAVSA